MFKNYLKIASRNANRQKLYTLINISGLAVGLAIFILAILYSGFHFSFDRFHKDGDRIFVVHRVIPSDRGGILYNQWTPTPLLQLMLREFPEIETAVRWNPNITQMVRYGDKTFFEKRVCYADSNFFKFFSFDMTAGDPETSLARPNSTVITETAAARYFGPGEDPIGKVLHITAGNKEMDFTVTGVTRTTRNSSIVYDLLVSAPANEWADDWDQYVVTFLRLKPGIDPAQMEAKFSAFIDKYIPGFRDRHERMNLFPFQDIHLNSIHVPGPFFHTTSPIQFYLVMVMAVLLLVVVCINFMNLSTARYMNRAKEVGLRKVVGAARHQLVKQFLGESIFLAFISLPIGITLFELIRPGFMAIVGGNMDISLWRSPLLLMGLPALTLLVGIIAGSYPAFFLSSFKPAHALKKDLQTGVKGTRVRKILVVVQFTITVIAMVFTFTVARQLDYLADADLGYNRENIVTLRIERTMKPAIEPLRNELLKHPGIISVSASRNFPFNWIEECRVRAEGMTEEDAWTMDGYPVGYDYIETLGIKLLKGRSFSRRYRDENNYVISETAAGKLGWDDPMGKPLTVRGTKGTVIGVVADFHFRHVFYKNKPALLYLRPTWINHLFIKCSSPPGAGVRQYIREQWNRFVPAVPYEFSLLGDRFDEQLRDSTKAAEIFKYISIIAVFISCLGLFGLVSHTVERKTKEIGIRKTLGASVPGIVRMFVVDFTKLVVLANIIALPFAYYASHWFIHWAWVYKTGVGVIVFLLAAVLSLLSAVLSVFFQTVKAAIANPVEALRYE
jgi:putative ABC transport system permease protein